MHCAVISNRDFKSKFIRKIAPTPTTEHYATGLVLWTEPITISFVLFVELKLTTVDRCSANCTNQFFIGAVRRTAPITVRVATFSLSINQFKARLDKFWLHQDILYDYTADLTGIGDRSVFSTCNKRWVVSHVVVLNRCGHRGVNICVRTCSLSWVSQSGTGVWAAAPRRRPSGAGLPEHHRPPQTTADHHRPNVWGPKTPQTEFCIYHTSLK